MHQDLDRVLYTKEEIADFVAKTGERISEDYADKDVVLIAVLKGAAIFIADLARAISIPLEIDFMAVSSYGPMTKSSGVVRIVKDLTADIKGRDVIIAEDIIDSGLTLKYLAKNLASRGPRSVEIAAMFEKEGVQKVAIDCKYPGLMVPNEFVVGYGLDYSERYRNLPYLGVLKREVYDEG